MSLYQCQACFDYQEEMLDLNNGCGAQVPCFCYTLQELFAQYLVKQNIVVIPDDPELESAMMELGEEVVSMLDDVELEGAMMELGDVTMDLDGEFDGFDREILEGYDSQLYQLPEELDIEHDSLKWLLGGAFNSDYNF